MNEQEYAQMFAVEERHWWYVALHELLLECLRREGREELELLDAGCGTGRFLQLAVTLVRASGCDAAEVALTFARKRGVTVFKADLNRADLGTERYDVITAIDVLYHQAIEDDARVLASLQRALRPGGVLLLNLVAYEWLRSTHDVAVQTRKRYCKRDFLPQVEAAGFVVEQASYRLAFLLGPIAFYRLLLWQWQKIRPGSAERSDLKMPPAWLNRLLLGLARLENRLILGRGVPCGSSLFVVARKPNSPATERG